MMYDLHRSTLIYKSTPSVFIIAESNQPPRFKLCSISVQTTLLLSCITNNWVYFDEPFLIQLFLEFYPCLKAPYLESRRSK